MQLLSWKIRKLKRSISMRTSPLRPFWMSKRPWELAAVSVESNCQMPWWWVVYAEIFVHPLYPNEKSNVLDWMRQRKDIFICLPRFLDVEMPCVGKFCSHVCCCVFLKATWNNSTEGGNRLLSRCPSAHQQHKCMPVYCWCSEDNAGTTRNG